MTQIYAFDFLPTTPHLLLYLPGLLVLRGQHCQRWKRCPPTGIVSPSPCQTNLELFTVRGSAVLLVLTSTESWTREKSQTQFDNRHALRRCPSRNIRFLSSMRPDRAPTRTDEKMAKTSARLPEMATNHICISPPS